MREESFLVAAAAVAAYAAAVVAAIAVVLVDPSAEPRMIGDTPSAVTLCTGESHLLLTSARATR